MATKRDEKAQRSRPWWRAALLAVAGGAGALALLVLGKGERAEPVASASAATPAPAPQQPRPPTPYERLPPVLGRIGQKELKKELLKPVLEGVEGGSAKQEQLAAELAWMTAKGQLQHEVLYREAKRRGIEMSPEDRQTIELLENQRERAQSTVGQFGIDAADAIQKYRETMSIKRLVEMEIYDKVQVSPEEIQAAYERYTEAYWHPETFRVRRILVAANPEQGREHLDKAMQRAMALYHRANEPKADFAALARAESDDPNRAQGGLLGEFDLKEAPIRDRRIIQLIRSIELKRASYPVYTTEGFQILYVEQRTPSRRMTLTEATPLVRKAMQYEKGGDEALRWTEALERAAGAELLIPKPPSLDAPPSPGAP